VKVYILESYYPYEGSDIIAVYANEDRAGVEMDKRNAEMGELGSDRKFTVTEYGVTDDVDDKS